VVSGSRSIQSMMTRSTSAVLDSQKSEHGGKQGKVVIRIQAGKVKPWQLVLDSGTIYAAGFYAKSVLPLSSDGRWEQLAGFRPVPSDEARIQVKKDDLSQGISEGVGFCRSDGASPSSVQGRWSTFRLWTLDFLTRSSSRCCSEGASTTCPGTRRRWMRACDITLLTMGTPTSLHTCWIRGGPHTCTCT